MRYTLEILTSAAVCLTMISPSAHGQSDLRKALGIIQNLQGQRSQPAPPPKDEIRRGQSLPSEGSDRNIPDQRYRRDDGLIIGPPIIVQPQPGRRPGNGQQPIIDNRPRDQFGRLIQTQPIQTQQPISSGQSQIQPGESYYYDEFGRRIVLPPQPLRNSQPINTQPIRTNPIGQSSSDIPSAPVDMSRNPHIVIRCPGSTAETLPYSLESDKGKYQFRISGGQEQRFRQSTTWAISFHNGMTIRKYRLEGGKTYTVRKGDDNQWKLTGMSHPGS